MTSFPKRGNRDRIFRVDNSLYLATFIIPSGYVYFTNEEGANKHIETEYARYNSGEVEKEMICLRGKDSFKEGANWAINEFLKDLWHDIFNECIPLGKMVIVEYTHKDGIYYRSLKIPDDTQWVRGFSNEKRLRRWLYVDDLLPKEEYEQY